MHSLKEIRRDFKDFAKKINQRNSNVDIKKLQNFDNDNRKLIQKKEKLEQEKKIISKTKDSSLFEKSKNISKEISLLQKEQLALQSAIDDILNNLPNLALSDVPVGKDDRFNKIISTKKLRRSLVERNLL